MLIKQIKRTIKEESLWHLFLRTLKVLAIKTHHFTLSIPCIVIGLFKEKVVKNINSYKMILYLSDKGIARELFIHGKREVFGTDLLYNNRLVEKGNIVLDIGANIGYFALIESDLVGDKGKVYAVEPSFVNYKRLKENISINGFNNILTYNLAIGDRQGKAKMYVSDRSNWSRLIERDLPDKIKEVIEVDLQTVDYFLKDKAKPNFIRMDVEGYEINIFRGMTQTLRLEKLRVFFEMHPAILSKEEIAEIFDLFEQNGFDVKYCLLNPMLDRNPLISFAYAQLGEYNSYKGQLLETNISQARKWALETNFMKCPHFLFCKG